MKKLIVLIMVLSLVMLCGCNQAANNENTTTAPNAADPTGAPAGNETTGGVGEPTDPIDWETPIDIDDSFIEEQPDETKPTEPGSTEPDATEPDPTQGDATEPAPTEPDATETEPTEPAPSKPSGSTGSKPIELPMIPG